MKANNTFCIAASLAALAMGGGAQAQDEVTIETADLGGGVYMLVGQGGNIGLSTGPDGTLMIDDQFDRISDNILAKVGELTDEPLKYVLNTHYHGDHTGGNEAMHAAGGTIVAHKNVRLRLASGDQPAAEAALPVITHENGMTFHWNGHEIQIHYVPSAHTDGDSLVYFPDSNIIHTGDTFMSGLYPYIDRAGGGSLDGYIANLHNLAGMADEETQIIPGHGPLSGRAEVLALLDALEGGRDAVAALMAQGLDREAVLAADPLAEWNDTYSWSFISGERMTGIIYDELSLQ